MNNINLDTMASAYRAIKINNYSLIKMINKDIIHVQTVYRLPLPLTPCREITLKFFVQGNLVAIQ